MSTGIGIVIPAYQPDPDRLGSYIDDLEATLSPDRIHVELDEPTRAVTERVTQTEATVATAQHRRGKGRAITAGFERLDTPILSFVDADGSTSADAIQQILEPVCNEAVDLAIGSRRHPKSIVTVHQSRLRRRLGDGFALTARHVLPLALYDYQCGAKVLSRQTWNAIRTEIVDPGFAWDIDVLTAAHRNGCSIEEVPITWEDRSGSTVTNLSTGIAFAKAVMRARHRDRLQADRIVHTTLSRFISEPTPLIDVTSKRDS